MAMAAFAAGWQIRLWVSCQRRSRGSNDRASDIQAKTREYLAAGARLVGIIDPVTETVRAPPLG